MRWVWRILISLDQLANAVFGWALNRMLGFRGGPFGHPDETISSVLGKLRYAGALGSLGWMYRTLNWLDPDHCEKSIEWLTGWTIYKIERELRDDTRRTN